MKKKGRNSSFPFFSFIKTETKPRAYLVHLSSERASFGQSALTASRGTDEVIAFGAVDDVLGVRKDGLRKEKRKKKGFHKERMRKKGEKKGKGG